MNSKLKYLLSITGILYFLLFGKINSQQSDSLYSKNYNLDEIVVSSNRFKLKQRTAPSAVELIPQKEVEKINGTTLGDLLSTSPRVTLKSYGSSPLLQTISLNGLGAEHTLILLDGIRLNSYQNSNVDLSQIPAELIGNIEISGSGSSSLYGSDAIGGVVNLSSSLNSNRFSEKNYSIRANLYSGSYRYKYYGIGYSLKLGSLIAELSTSMEESKNDFEYYYHRDDEKFKKNREKASYKNYNGSLKLNYVINESSIIKYLGYYTIQDKNIPGIETGITPPDTKQNDKLFNNYLKYENVVNKKYDFTASFNYQNNLSNYSTLPFIDNFYKNIVYAFNTQHNLKLFSTDLNLAYDFVHAELYSAQIDGNPFRNNNAFSFASKSILSPGTIIYTSGRFENFSDINKNVATGKIGINYQPFTKYIFNIRGSFGNNFRAPSFNDLYWVNSGNRNLKPETSLNFETGFYLLPIKEIPLTIDASYTYINAKEKIAWSPTPSGLWKPQNIAKSLSKITNINLNYSFMNKKEFSVKVSAGYSLNDTRSKKENYPGDPTFEKQLFYIPISTGKFNLYLSQGNFGFNLFYSYTGPRFADMENKYSLVPVNIVNTNFSIKFLAFDVEAKLQVEVNNLFNNDYQIISGYPMPLRNYLLKFSINY